MFHEAGWSNIVLLLAEHSSTAAVQVSFALSVVAYKDSPSDDTMTSLTALSYD